MEKAIYAVHSDVDENNVYNEFDILEDAIKYAKDHIADKTWVEWVGVEVNDFDEVVDEYASEILWSYEDEENLEPAEDSISKSEIFEEEPKEDEFEIDESLDEVEQEETSEDAEELSEDWWFTPDEFVGPEVDAECADCEPEAVFVDPFDQNFSLADVSEDEANYQKALEEPVDYLWEIAKELGIEDQVAITATNQPTKTELLIKAEVPENVIDQISDNDQVKVELPPEADQAVVSGERVAVDAPCEGECCDGHCEEKQICPECGKEICECNKKLDEGFNQSELSRFMDACKKLGFESMIEVTNFAKEHGDVKDQELLVALEKAAAELHEELNESTNDVAKVENFLKSKPGQEISVDDIEEEDGHQISVAVYYDDKNDEFVATYSDYDAANDNNAEHAELHTEIGKTNGKTLEDAISVLPLSANGLDYFIKNCCEEDDMSDEEFVEALGKAIAEKRQAK